MAATPARRSRPNARLLAAFTRPECYPHPVGRVRLLETHISWVLLTGQYAYKIKKPIDLGFVDFTTLGLRRHYCEEEVRLNRRLAPELYLGVVEVHGTPEAPRIGGEGPLIEYAVRMREFPQEALAARLLERGHFGAAEVDALAAVVAAFHAAAPPAPPAGRLGSPAAVIEPAMQNFHQMLSLALPAADKAALHALERWTEREFEARRAAFAARRRDGRVRECHGDLHLGNIAVIDGRPVPFDCIEFNDDLRWIDVASETAFVFMDLVDRKHPELAWRFLNRYLEETGDYEGLAVMRFYVIYRALVRAKVHLLRMRQPDVLVSARSRLQLAFGRYLRLSERLARLRVPALIITHGASGSGKTTTTQRIVEEYGGIRVRSDIERKRLHGMRPLDRDASAAAGLYGPEATAATYARLMQVAEYALDSGCPAVVDAAFLRRAEREAFRAAAARLRVPFVILDFDAPEALLRERVAARTANATDASDADLAVLERQLASREPLAPEEAQAAIRLDAARLRHRPNWPQVMREIALRAGTEKP